MVKNLSAVENGPVADAGMIAQLLHGGGHALQKILAAAKPGEGFSLNGQELIQLAVDALVTCP